MPSIQIIIENLIEVKHNHRFQEAYNFEGGIRQIQTYLKYILDLYCCVTSYQNSVA